MFAGPKNRLAIRETALDLLLARKIATNGFLESPGADSTADLRQFKSIHPDAIRYLSQFAYTWVEFGLDWLTPALAKEISAWKAGAFIFRDGMETTPESLRCLGESKARLRFGDIGDALDQDSAAALSKGRDFLALSTHVLSPEIARQLARFPACLELRVKEQISPEAVRQLAAHIGEQCVLHLTQPLTPELMIPLAEAAGKRFLDLSGHANAESRLLICSMGRYSEIMSFLDLPMAMALIPDC